MFASAFLLDITTTAAVNDIIAGALVVVFGTMSALAFQDRTRGDSLAPRP